MRDSLDSLRRVRDASSYDLRQRVFAMKAPFRDTTETLSAENERLRQELASTKDRPMEFILVGRSIHFPHVLVLMGWGIWSYVFTCVGFAPLVQRLLGVVVVATAVWCLAFVRRVPADQYSGSTEDRDN